MVKVISLSDEAYELLLKVKKGSFSDTIKRLVTEGNKEKIFWKRFKEFLNWKIEVDEKKIKRLKKRWEVWKL